MQEHCQSRAVDHRHVIVLLLGFFVLSGVRDKLFKDHRIKRNDFFLKKTKHVKNGSKTKDS